MRVREIANTYARTVLFQFTWDRESVTTRLSLCHSFIIPPLTEVKRLLDTLAQHFFSRPFHHMATAPLGISVPSTTCLSPSCFIFSDWLNFTSALHVQIRPESASCYYALHVGPARFDNNIAWYVGILNFSLADSPFPCSTCRSQRSSHETKGTNWSQLLMFCSIQLLRKYVIMGLFQRSKMSRMIILVSDRNIHDSVFFCSHFFNDSSCLKMKRWSFQKREPTFK